MSELVIEEAYLFCNDLSIYLFICVPIYSDVIYLCSVLIV